MRNRFAVAVVATVFAAAPLVTAAPAAAQTAAERAEVEAVFAAMRTWVGQSSTWMGGSHEILAQRTAHLYGLRTGADAFENMAGSRPKAEVEAEIETWMVAQRALLAQDRAALAALPPPPPLNIAQRWLDEPEIRESLRGPVAHFTAMPAKFTAFLDMTELGAETFMAEVAAAAVSPAQDREVGSQVARIGLAIATTNSESALLDAAMAPEGTQRFVTAATIQSNRAKVEWYGYLRDVWIRRDPQVAARTTAIRNSAREVRANADRVVEAAVDYNRSMVDNPGFQDSRGQDFLARYHRSFNDSAAVEQEMAVVLDRLADALDAGDSDAAQGIMASSVEIATRRGRLQQERDAMHRQLGAF